LEYPSLKEHIQDEIFRKISAVAETLNVQAFIIGGYVRDIILKRESKDIDIVTSGSGIELAEQLSKNIGGKSKVKIFKNFGTAMIHTEDFDLEFVGARKESYRADSRKPLVEDGTLEDDQKRRDFTINAIAISLQKENFGDVVDPFEGIKDIENKSIRTPLDPDITFSDDPLRMMRAIRFATQLNFKIDNLCFESIAKNAERIEIVSRERISDELNKIIASAKPSIGIELLSQSGLLKLIFPQFEKLKGIEIIEQKGHKDNFDHTLQVLDKIAMQTDNLWLRWAAILHDIAKPVTKKFIAGTGWTFYGHDFKGAKMAESIFRMMRLPLNEKLTYVKKLITLHLRPAVLAEDIVTDSAVRRLLIEAGDDVDDLMMLCEADITSKNVKKVEKYLHNFEVVRQKLKEIEEKDKLRNWQPPIDGDKIMHTFGIEPCREVGIIKTAIREAILDGIIGNNFDEAYDFMVKEGQKLKLSVKK
jgi:poly(A) polymerase